MTPATPALSPQQKQRYKNRFRWARGIKKATLEGRRMKEERSYLSHFLTGDGVNHSVMLNEELTVTKDFAGGMG